MGIIQDIVLQSSALVLYLDGFQRQYGLVGLVTLTGYGNSIPAAADLRLRRDDPPADQLLPTVPTSISDNKPILNNGATASFRGGPQTNEIRVEQGV